MASMVSYLVMSSTTWLKAEAGGDGALVISKSTIVVRRRLNPRSERCANSGLGWEAHLERGPCSRRRLLPSTQPLVDSSLP